MHHRDIKLNDSELFHAMIQGMLRRMTSKQLGRKHAYGDPTVEPWSMEVQACAAELLVAKTLGLFWHLDTTFIHDLPGDCGDVQVRHTLRTDGRLILHDRDHDEARFVLVVGAYPDLRLAGWIVAREGKTQANWWEGTGRPAYFVRQADLHPMSDWID